MLEMDKYPAPVQRYIKYVFKDNKPVKVRGIQWKERGEFILPDAGKFSMSAWQVSRMDEVIYIWRGFMKKLGGLITLESLDSFNRNTHEMRAKLYGLKTIMSSSYNDPAEVNSLHSYLMLRYYGTALNFPWVLFTSPNIEWKAIDSIML